MSGFNWDRVHREDHLFRAEREGHLAPSHPGDWPIDGPSGARSKQSPRMNEAPRGRLLDSLACPEHERVSPWHHAAHRKPNGELIRPGRIVTRCRCGWRSEPFVERGLANDALSRHITGQRSR